MLFRLCVFIIVTCLSLAVVARSEPCSAAWQKCGRLRNETYGILQNRPSASWPMRQENVSNTEQADSHCRPATALAHCLASVLQRCPDDPEVERFTGNGGWYDAETWMMESRICELSLHAVGFNLALAYCEKQLPDSQKALMYADYTALAQASNNATMAHYNLCEMLRQFAEKTSAVASVELIEKCGAEAIRVLHEGHKQLHTAHCSS
ncbi:uncharacterized protein LOC129588832 [Paramacrobiotus metropolitanus]|uniref:uncharacterized protein LOC129588832 n=1 Tax=Paramacrobiotus metropolitanus TaxID=2943436 RepID=UPI0024461C01|nr:uncharacterized protein LOC129588832 [Paramacrobiotus metropolitanus]